MEMNDRKNTNLLCKVFLILVFSVSVTGMNAQEILTLDKALSYAEKGSPDLQSQELNLTRNQKTLEAQRDALKSQFSLSVEPINYSNSRRFDARTSQWFTNKSFTTLGTFRISQPILPTDGTISLNNQFEWQNSSSLISGAPAATTNKAFQNNLYVSLTQPLFTYNRTKVQLTQLQLNLENAQISYALQRLNLERTVTQDFYNVYLDQENLRIARDEMKNTQESYDITKNKYNAGLSAKDELIQAELNLYSAISTVQNDSISLENSKDQLKLYLGMDLYQDITVLADTAANPVPVNLDKAITNGLNSRMELRQREIDIQNGQFSMLAVKAQNEFKGSMNLNFGFTGDDANLGNIYANPTKSPQVTLSFDIPLYDWGEKKARIAAQEASNQTNELNLSNEKNQIVISIRQVYRNLMNELNQITIARKNQTDAEVTYDLNLDRYQNGDLTSMELEQFQTQLSQKKIALAQAKINYKIELLNLKIQSLYDFVNNKPVLPKELYLTNNTKNTNNINITNNK